MLAIGGGHLDLARLLVEKGAVVDPESAIFLQEKK
jgi:hypothetical protein